MQVVRVKSVPYLVKVEKQEFEEATEMKEPYYVDVDGKPENKRQFALCPNCDNPVQLIGLYLVDPKVTPHARHILESVENLGKFILENYELCHWRRRGSTSNKRRSHDNPVSQAIVEKLITNFDQIIYFLEKETGMYFGKPLLTSYLKEYFAVEKWLFSSAGLLNIPFVLVEGSVAKSLNGRIIFNNHELIAAIEKATGIPIINGKVGWLDTTPEINFSFQWRTTNTDTGVEEMRFRVYTGGKRIHDQVMVLDPTYMESLYTYPREKLSEGVQEKNLNRIKLAKSIAAKFGFYSEKIID